MNNFKTKGIDVLCPKHKKINSEGKWENYCFSTNVFCNQNQALICANCYSRIVNENAEQYCPKCKVTSRAWK